MIGLPIDDAKTLISAATGSAVNPISLVDLLDSLLAIGKDALKYGRTVGALYRDSVELEVQLWLATPAIDDRPPPFRVTEADVAPLRAIYEGRNDDLPAWLAAIAVLRNRGLEPVPQPRFFAELAGLMKHICTLITQEPSSLERCQAGLPTTVPPATPVLSTRTVTFGRVIRQPAIGGSPGGPRVASREASLAPANKNSGTRIPTSQIETIQANLCVPPTGRIDNATKEAIRQAKIGARQNTLTSTRFDNNENDIKSNAEAQIFLDARNCSKDTTGAERAYSTPFEKFRFADRVAINGLRHLLNSCDRDLNLQDSDLFDQAMRGAIAAVKNKAPDAEKRKFGAPDSGTLDDTSFEYIRRTCTP
jgi:hypothetical protein